MKKTLLFLVAIVLVLTSSAQFIEEEASTSKKAPSNEPKFTDKLFFGGDLGLMFGSYTYVNISPIVGYRISPEFSAGIGAVYEYHSDNRVKGYKYSTSIYGGKLFAQYVLFDKVILYAENNLISLESRYFDLANNYPKEGRFLLDVPWIGGGLYQSMGNGGMYFLMLFNLNTGVNSPYAPYEFRIGFNL